MIAIFFHVFAISAESKSNRARLLHVLATSARPNISLQDCHHNNADPNAANVSEDAFAAAFASGVADGADVEPPVNDASGEGAAVRVGVITVGGAGAFACAGSATNEVVARDGCTTKPFSNATRSAGFAWGISTTHEAHPLCPILQIVHHKILVGHGGAKSASELTPP